jgi:hypothetical protein
MSADVRLLYRPGQELNDIPGDGAPRGTSKEAQLARNNLGDFLDAMLLRPLWFDESRQMQRVEQALTSMTLPERVMLEIEMTERAKTVHSYDYDPLR